MKPADLAYNARLTVSGDEFSHMMATYRKKSDAAVRSLASQGSAGYEDIIFDPTSGEALDIWGVTANGGGALRPAYIAIHGGYWRALSRFDTAFMAAALEAEGIATVTVDYSLAPTVTLAEIVRQVRAAVAWVYHHGAEYGIDPEQIYVLGSSAGGHLAAMTMVGGWQSEFSVPEDVVHGGVLVSGLFDLRPLIDTEMNSWLFLDESKAKEVSPMFAPVTSTPSVIALGENEASGFFDQSERFHQMRSAQAQSTYKVVEGKHHFDVFLELADPDSWMFRHAVGLVIGN